MNDVVIKGPVGAFIPARQMPVLNDFGDQALVVTMLYAIGPGEGGSFGELMPLITHHTASEALAKRIKVFQDFWPNILNAEDKGVVQPRSATLRQLNKLTPSLARLIPSGDYQVEITPEGVGDGHRVGSIPVVEPNSLFSGQQRTLKSAAYAVTLRLVKVSRGNARFWFGVAIPDGCARFDAALVHFHPTAKAQVYPDADYADFTGAWRYLHRNNLTPVAQQAAATLKAPVIVPYMRNAAAVSAALNPFAADAAGILNAVMAACLRIARPGDLGVAKVSSLSLSSYSAGMDYLLASLPHLRATGAVREIIDLDSGFIVGSGKRLLPGSAARIVVISQVARPPLFPGTFIRDARWWGLPNDMGGMFETHQRILYEALYPALTRSIL